MASSTDDAFDEALPTLEELESAMPSLYQEYKALVTPSEVPLEFHPFCFLALLSAIAGDRLGFREGNDLIYCNLWILLLGETSIPRKTTAIRPVIKILSHILWVKQLASRGSPEGFFQSISNAQGTGYFYHPELGVVLAAMKRDYMSGLADELCEYYDPPSGGITKQLSQKEFKVECRAISWIACTTPVSLNQFATAHRVAGGFLPRWCVVFGKTVSEQVPFRPAKSESALKDFAKNLEKRFEQHAVARTFTFSPEATEIYSAWYKRQHSKLSENEFTAAFRVRTVEAVKKIAVLFAVLEGDTNIVDASSMRRAITIGAQLIANAERLAQEELALTFEEQELRRVMNAIRRIELEGRSATLREILRHTGMRADRVEPYLRTLEERGDIERITGTRTSFFRSVKVSTCQKPDSQGK